MKIILVIDFDGIRVYTPKPLECKESSTHYLDLNYIIINQDWFTMIDERVDAFLQNNSFDKLILTVRHPILKEEISKICDNCNVICRDFDLNIDKIKKRKITTHSLFLKRWMKKTVKHKTKALKRLTKKHDLVFFLDDDWKLYKHIKNKKIVVLEPTWKIGAKENE
jgi:hypothetical protein